MSFPPRGAFYQSLKYSALSFVFSNWKAFSAVLKSGDWLGHCFFVFYALIRSLDSTSITKNILFGSSEFIATSTPKMRKCCENMQNIADIKEYKQSFYTSNHRDPVNCCRSEQDTAFNVWSPARTRLKGLNSDEEQNTNHGGQCVCPWHVEQRHSTGTPIVRGCFAPWIEKLLGRISLSAPQKQIGDTQKDTLINMLLYYVSLLLQGRCLKTRLTADSQLLLPSINLSLFLPAPPFNF